MEQKNFERPNWDEYFLKLLETLRLRGTCPRRQCSALIVDEKHNLLSTGYNGSPRGIVHCIDHPCGGQDDKPGDVSNCIALHSEENAVLQLGVSDTRMSTMYCTNKPCFHCAKIICQTSIIRVVFLEDYADNRGAQLLRRKGIRLDWSLPNGIGVKEYLPK